MTVSLAPIAQVLVPLLALAVLAVLAYRRHQHHPLSRLAAALAATALAVASATAVYAQGTAPVAPPGPMASQAEMWSYVVAFATPIVVNYLAGDQLTHWARMAIAAAFCVLIAAVNLYFAHQFDITDLVTTFLRVLVAAIASYVGIFEFTNLGPKIRANAVFKRDQAVHRQGVHLR